MFEEIAARADQPHAPMPDPQSATFIFPIHYLQHEIDVCETGYGMFQTTYKITKAISQKRYHLALKASFCNAYKPELKIGEVVNVIKDKPGSPTLSMADEGKAADLYDQGLMDMESFPHFKGAFINMNNSYMNVMMPFKKVVSLTVGRYADLNDYQMNCEKYKADIETTDGLGFVYPCMYERQPFYQLNAVERNLATGEDDFEKAKLILNETLLDILQKL